jgi:hypothetical protein
MREPKAAYTNDRMISDIREDDELSEDEGGNESSGSEENRIQDILARRHKPSKGARNSRAAAKKSLADMVDDKIYEVDTYDDNSNELHSSLHPDVNFKLNSINILVGQTGNGKSRAVFSEVAKQSMCKNNPYSQFFYITDLGSDKTFDKYKNLIRILVIKLKYAEAHQRLSELAEAKDFYQEVREKVRNKRSEVKMSKEDARGLLSYLGLRDFSATVPHTIILFDDATNIFGCNRKKKDSFQDSFFLCNRHNYFTYFFNIHTYNKNKISMEIKKNTKAVWYFERF